MQESTRTVVTLIHGTWASKTWRKEATSWPQLSKALEASLPKPVKLDHFTWDGRNRVNIRANAARELQRHVKELYLPPSVQQYYIVAHSHGGTVAVMALRDPEVRKRIDGLVCLSTPFLHASPRKMVSISDEMFGAALLTNFVLVAWLGRRILAWSLLHGIGVGFLVVVVAIAISGLVHNYAFHVKARMKLPNLGKFPLLILRAPGDDTSLPLAAFRCVGWLASSASRLVSGAASFVASTIEAVMGGDEAARATEKHVSRTVIGAIAVAYVISATVFAYFWYGYNFSWVWIFFGGDAHFALRVTLVMLVPAVAAMGLVSWVAVAIYIAAAVIAAPTSLLVGPELVVAGLSLDVDVETAPPGRCQIIQLTTSMRGTRLQHSTHSNRAAIRYVTAWLSSLARGHAVRGAAAHL